MSAGFDNLAKQMEFKDQAGRALPADVNRAVGRHAGTVLTGSETSQSDSDTLKNYMAARDRGGAEVATKKAGQSAPIARRGGTTGGRSNRSKGVVQRATLLGDSK